MSSVSGWLTSCVQLHHWQIVGLRFHFYHTLILITDGDGQRERPVPSAER